jgi:hypothetical protein
MEVCRIDITDGLRIEAGLRDRKRYPQRLVEIRGGHAGGAERGNECQNHGAYVSHRVRHNSFSMSPTMASGSTLGA